jgi:hypothetical protein
VKSKRLNSLSANNPPYQQNQQNQQNQRRQPNRLNGHSRSSSKAQEIGEEFGNPQPGNKDSHRLNDGCMVIFSL